MTVADPAAPSAVAASAVHLADGGFATVPQAAAFLGLSRTTIYNLMDNGSLRYAKFGKSRRVPWAALRSFGASRLVGA